MSTFRITYKNLTDDTDDVEAQEYVDVPPFVDFRNGQDRQGPIVVLRIRQDAVKKIERLE